MSEEIFSPLWVVHPGDQLEEFLKELNLTQKDFAIKSGLTTKLVNTIIKGKNPVTAETAIKLEKALGLSAKIWLSMQNDWDLFYLRQQQTA